MSLVGIQFKPFWLTQCHMGLLFSICALVLMAGCEQGKSPSAGGGKPVVAPVEKKNAEVTFAEAGVFVKEYLSAINKFDRKAIQELIDWDAIVDRTFNGLATNTGVYKEYSGGGKKILGNFAKSIQVETGAGGNYAFLKTVRRGKDRHVVFRLITGNSAPGGGGRIDYHNFRLIKKDGQVRADDIYIARKGAWFSETYKDALRPAVLNSQKSAVGFTTKQSKEMEGYRVIAEMVHAANSGNQEKAIRLYQELPEDVQTTKRIMAARLLATDRDEFFTAVDAMNSEYPNNPAVGLGMVDFGMRTQDVETLKKADESLAKWTTGDPYIGLNIAALMLKQGNVEAAAEFSKEIDVKEFDFRYPVFLKFNIALASKDNETLLKCFRIFRDDYDDDIEKILKTKVCKNFVESLEYLDLKND